MFQRRFNGKNEKVLMIRKKRMFQRGFNGKKKKSFLGKKKVVSKVKKRDVSTVSTFRKNPFLTVKKRCFNSEKQSG